jgi:multidrug efflux pump subunit AcrA (membrane-fusion protein)
VLALGQLQQLDLRVLRQQAEEQKNRKGRSRARLQVGGELNAARAHELRAAKAELTAQKAQAKEARIAKQAANQARRQLAGLGVEAWKQERLRKKRVKAHIRAGNPIPPEDQDPILDPEAGSKPKPRSGSEAGFEPEAGSEAGSEAGFEPSFQFEPEAGFEPSFELELEPGFEFKLEPGSQLARELQYELE